MKLSEKYNVPEETIKAMIKDGWMNCSVAKYEEIFNVYRKERDAGISKPQAIANAAQAGKVSERAVYYIIQRFE